MKPIQGSEHIPFRGARLLGKPDPNEIIEITVVVRYRSSNNGPSSLVELEGIGRNYLNNPDFEKAYGADPRDLASVATYARGHNLRVLGTNALHRTVHISASLESLAMAFGLDFLNYDHPEGRYRGYSGAIRLPDQLESIVDGVFGLHNRPVGRPRAAHLTGNATLDSQTVKETRFTPQQLAHTYRFPDGFNGAGQRIAIIELTGGYKKADLDHYFSSLGLPFPQIKDVLVGNGKNEPIGNPESMDSEVVMDIEVAGALAPGAELLVYFAEKSERGFLHAIKKAIEDNVSIISISWGLPEVFVEESTQKAFNDAFRDAAARGITVCVASGDHGSRGRVTDEDDPNNLAHVGFPASSPFALACGGTELIRTGDEVTHEVVWNQPEINLASGGGISDLYDLPAYQRSANRITSVNPPGKTGRGIPDVAACAIGYPVRVDGKTRILGGTSAVAPLWAALIARINQKLGVNVGFVNPTLYAMADKGVFWDIVDGSNGAYHAERGWDPCTGLGSPNGMALLQAFQLMM